MIKDNGYFLGDEHEEKLFVVECDYFCCFC